jgi:hypothetical protein
LPKRATAKGPSALTRAVAHGRPAGGSREGEWEVAGGEAVRYVWSKAFEVSV